MTLERRLRQLEASFKGQDTIREPSPDLDSMIRKLGLDPGMVRATAEDNHQSIVEVIAGELGMSYKDFQAVVKRGAEGRLQ